MNGGSPVASPLRAAMSGARLRRRRNGGHATSTTGVAGIAGVAGICIIEWYM
jgi:hypothetical protein